jgi:hypothetical protein
MARDALHKFVLHSCLATSLLLLAACRPGGDGAAGSNAGGASAAASGLSVTIEVDGAATGPAAVTVGVRTGDEPETGATVKVVGNMTHAGMAPVLADAVEVEPGVYVADAFAFTMGGDWIVDAEVTTEDGREASAEAFLNVAR